MICPAAVANICPSKNDVHLFPQPVINRKAARFIGSVSIVYAIQCFNSGIIILSTVMTCCSCGIFAANQDNLVIF